MKEMESTLKQLGAAARREVSPEVDVCAEVLATLATHQSVVRRDVVPLLLSGAAVAVAASIVVVCLPSWYAMTDPWASYFAQAGQ